MLTSISIIPRSFLGSGKMRLSDVKVLKNVAPKSRLFAYILGATLCRGDVAPKSRTKEQLEAPMIFAAFFKKCLRAYATDYRT